MLLFFLVLTLVSYPPQCASQMSKINPADNAFNDQFGTSVAVSADSSVMVAGAPLAKGGTADDAGAVFVFFSSDSGATWGEELRLPSSTPTAATKLGLAAAVSADGSVIAVGSDGNDNDDSGSVYVFVRAGNTTGRSASDWSQNSITASTGKDASAHYGSALDLSADGRTLIVGSFGLQSQTGVFLVSLDTDGSQLAQVRVSSSAVGPNTGVDELGTAVAISGDGLMIAAGAPLDDTQSVDNVGSVTVWRRSSATSGSTWTEVRVLDPSDGANGDGFGRAVAFSEDGAVLVVGAPNAADDRGSAYIYSTSTWTVTKVGPSEGETGDAFGGAVAVSPSGTAVVVGARLSDEFEGDAVLGESGKAYVYSKSPTGQWVGTVVKTKDLTSGASFAGAVALHRNAFVSGAFRDSSIAQTSGTVFVYSCPTGEWFDTTAAGSGQCRPCEAGWACPSLFLHQKCPLGMYAVAGAPTCSSCPANTACPDGAAAPTVCAEGFRAPRESESCIPCRDIHRLLATSSGTSCAFKSTLGVPQEPIIALGVFVVFVVPIAVGSAGLTWRDVLTFIVATADIMSDILYVTTQPFVNPVVHFAAVTFLVLPWLIMNLTFPPKLCGRPIAWLDVHSMAQGRQLGFFEAIRAAYANEYERLFKPPTRAAIAAAQHLFESFTEDLQEFATDTLFDSDSRFWKFPPKSYNNWDTPKQVLAAPFKVLLAFVALCLVGVLLLFGAVYFVAAVILCVLLTPVWAVLQGLMFVFAPILPPIFYALYGQFLLLTKLVSVKVASDHWLPWWRGQKVSSTVSSSVFAKLVYIELFLESVPQLVIQSVNNVGQWNPFAYVSLALSVIVVLHSLRVIVRNVLASGWTPSKSGSAWEQAQDLGEKMLNIKFLSVAKKQAAQVAGGGVPAGGLQMSSSSPSVSTASSSAAAATTAAQQQQQQQQGTPSTHRMSLQLLFPS